MSRGNVLIGRELVNENNYRVLVALDSSEASLVALQTSVALFDTSSFDITLLHVVESPWAAFASGQSQDEDVDFSEIDEYQRQLGNELRQTADTVLESAMRHLERFAIPVTSLIKEGDPALEICSEAEQGGYDLVVAGATGVFDVKHVFLGSVSLKVAWDCPCSVAIIRQGVR
jgi:nucleotide-binding universal stress UspA family protein